MLLLEQGATVTDSALHNAVSTPGIDKALIGALLATGITPDGTLERPNVAAAAKANNLETLNLLLAAGASPSPLATDNFNPPLMYAAENGNVEMVDALLAAGAEPDQRNQEDETSLYQASFKNQTESMKRLIAAGADVNSRNREAKATPLMEAANNGYKDAILILIGAQADPNISTTNGYTPLYYAAGSNHPDAVTMLMAMGADPEQVAGSSQWTPVHKAAWEGNYEVLENLLKYGANANARDSDGDTPMDLAMRKGYEKTPRVLGSYGGKINNYTPPKQSSGDTFGKVFATAAIAGLASSADIPSYATADIMSATVKDIWIEDGQGTNMMELQQQYAQGNFEIRDPVVKQAFSASLEAEKETARLKKQLAQEQAAQRQQQKLQRKQLEAQRKASQAEYRRRQQLLQQQQQALAEQQARQQQLRQQQQAERARLQAARNSQAAAPVQVAYRNEPAAAASAPRRAPSARQASIQHGTMQSSDKLNCPSCKGTLTQRNVTIGECTLSSIKVAYDVGVFFGEPVVRGDYTWRAASGTPEDCLDSSFAIWLKIQNGGAHGYVKVDPVVPKAGRESFSGTAGSPNWDEFICGFNGKQKTECFEPDDAKTLLKKGRITSFTYSVQ